MRQLTFQNMLTDLLKFFNVVWSNNSVDMTKTLQLGCHWNWWHWNVSKFNSMLPIGWSQLTNMLHGVWIKSLPTEVALEKMINKKNIFFFFLLYISGMPGDLIVFWLLLSWAYRWEKSFTCSSQVSSLKCYFTQVGLWWCVQLVYYFTSLTIFWFYVNWLRFFIPIIVFACTKISSTISLLPLFSAVAELLDNAVDEVIFLYVFIPSDLFVFLVICHP